MGSRLNVPTGILLDNLRIATRPAAERSAIAIRDGRILSVGDPQTALDTADTRLRRVDCAGLVAAPGFNDSHTHPISRDEPDVLDLAPETSIEGVLNRVERAAHETPTGRWIEGVGIGDGRLLRDRRMPTTTELDAISQDHLIYVRGGTQAAVNSAVLKRLDGPQASPARNGHEDDRTMGLVRDVERIAPRSSLERDGTQLDGFLGEMAAYGITTVTDFGSSGYDVAFDRDLAVYDALRRQGSLATRCRVSYRVPVGANITEVAADLRSREVATGSGDDLLKIGPIKVVVDGGGFEGALLRSEYPGRAGYCGVQFLEAPELRMLTEVAIERDWQLAVHAIGGAAIDMVLDVWTSFDHRTIADARFTLQHAFQPSPENMAVCRSLGIVVGIQQPLFYSLADVIIDHWGYAAAEASNPIRDWTEAAVSLAGGSDTAPRDPLTSISSLATREVAGGAIVGGDQAVESIDALRFYTEGSAQSSSEEHQLGSLRAGYLADIILLTDDPTSVATDQIRDIEVMATLVGGSPSFTSDQAPEDVRALDQASTL
jgi:predicted amidohydrolase YtcJ